MYTNLWLTRRLQTVKRYETSDGHYSYRVKKDRKWQCLGDEENYQKDIDDVISGLEGLKYDSLIIMFGIDTGAYLEALSQRLCNNNNVIIFEPNEEIYNTYKEPISDQIKLVLYKEKEVKPIIWCNINFLNFDRMYFHAFGNYAKVYKNEYEDLIENLDNAYVNASSCLSLADRFKEIFVDNMMHNLKILNDATSINHYTSINKNIPAIVVSAGPSLDKNIEQMLKYKDKLKNCFIITGSRTVGALVKNGIIPDMIVSVDPVNANYDMMKDYLDLEVPLAFYEYSNKTLLKDYKGEKVYIASLLPQIIEELHTLRGVYLGGSVAHSCIDIAYTMGCSPIILMGQDLAYTEGKHHAGSATYSHDGMCDHTCSLMVKDVFGNTIATTVTLNLFKENLERYIEIRKMQSKVEFINCAYGAAIEGASHKEVEKVLRRLPCKTLKAPLLPYKDIDIEPKTIIENIMNYINENIDSAEDGITICSEIIEEQVDKSLVDVEEDDIDLQKILYILQLVEGFETSSESGYLGGYFNRFMYDVKEKIFNKLAIEYEDFTSSLQHQARSFKIYFEEMKDMLETVKSLIAERVTE